MLKAPELCVFYVADLGAFATTLSLFVGIIVVARVSASQTNMWPASLVELVRGTFPLDTADHITLQDPPS